jgi:hypothetical protein
MSAQKPSTQPQQKQEMHKSRVSATQRLEEAPLLDQTHMASATQRAHIDPGSLSNQDVFGLQKTLGNQGLLRLLRQDARSHSAESAPAKAAPAAKHEMDAAGFAPELTEDDRAQDVGGGRTFGELVGDVARPIGTGLGNIVGDIAGAVTGVTISQNTTTAPTWNDHGHFQWVVGFTTTGTSGWIVQKIVNTRRAQDASGANLPDGLTPSYYEAWAVDASSNITPVSGGSHDWWQRRSWGTNTQGHWSMTGKVYFTTVDPATQGFTVGGVPEAGGLLATTSPGGGLDLGFARLHRYAQGTWDSTTATPTHDGSAH